ncbi:hypothetical protein Godav_025026 [Gossypium davidsonii]|uniref:RNase H type-1 domain-containing protein n=1 Tax=Gossypium davidsonii TaxID=34287 RepID=A0A7J8TH19_GOSDV|nr:hypothetical protein [Gossypium davidsonii]
MDSFAVSFELVSTSTLSGMDIDPSTSIDGVVGAACFWKSHVPTPLEVEAWACLEVIRFAMEISFRRVEFEGDSLLVITKMKSTITDRSDINMLIWEAKMLVTEFTAYRWSRHHPRCGARRAVTCWMGDFSTIMMVEGTDTLDLGEWQRHD